MANPVKIILEGNLQTIDFTKPDDLTVIWPMYRDVKADVATIIEGLLKQNKLSFIPVIKEGSFQPSLLQDDKKRWRPVVVITRSTDVAERMGLGEEIAYLIKDDTVDPPQMIDVTDKVLPNIPLGAGVNFLGQASLQTVSIDIFSINSQIADQLYGVLKIGMIASEKLYFMGALGYLDIIRSGGGDGEDIVIDFSGGPHAIANRILTYECKTLDFLAGADTLATLIESTFTGQEVQPDGSAEETVEIGN